MWVDLVDGRTLGVPLACLPRLLNASPVEPVKYVVSGGGTGLHWDDLDEDISVPALLLGVGDSTRKSASQEICEMFPESRSQTFCSGG